VTILVLSDTHLNSTKDIPAALLHLDKPIDRVIHAGDVTSREFLNRLSDIAPVESVRGNMDGGLMAADILEKQIIDLDGFRIGVVHGRFGGSETVRYARSQFRHVDLIVFGHTHVPFLEKVANVLLMNPGSLTQPREGNPPSFGLIETNGGSAECRIVTPVEKGVKVLAVATL
jgi:putative phosphoesterase